MNDKRVLREYVKLILEDEAGDAYAGAVDVGPYDMMSYGSTADLYKTFVEPFTDVFKVAAGKSKELAVKAQTLGKALFNTLASTVIPSFEGDYKEIFEDEKQKIEGLKRQYQPVYDRVWDAFNHDDVRLLAFMYDPFASGMFLSYFGGRSGMGLAIDALNIVTGGALDGVKKSFAQKAKLPGKAPTYQTGSGSDIPMESVIHEAVDVMSAVKSAMSSASVLQMRAAAQKVVQETLKRAYETARKVLRAGSLNDMRDDMPAELLQQFESLPANEKGQLERRALEVVKKSAREFFVKSLEDQLKRAVESGVPEKSAYVRDHRSTIQKIKSL